MNQSIDRSEYTPENTVFLEEIFGHEKCVHLSLVDREQVIDAYVLTQRAHKNDKRKDGTPYMNHIDGVMRMYLQITNKKSVSAADLCTATLHDAIEDHPEFAAGVLGTFGETIYGRVLGITKPSIGVLNETIGLLARSMLDMRYHAGAISRQYLTDKFISGGKTIMTHHPLRLKVVGLWRQQHLFNEKGLKNYRFLWMVAELSEDDFEIKCADRIDNLNKLVAVDIDYVNNNIESTDIYILKAGALGRDDLTTLLEQGMENLRQKKKVLELPTST